MSTDGKHLEMQDAQFLPFLDMIKICNYLQKEQTVAPLHFENTFLGQPGQFPLDDDTARMVEPFLGAPILLDAAGLGSTAHKMRLFWTNWCHPEILQQTAKYAPYY